MGKAGKAGSACMWSTFDFEVMYDNAEGKEIKVKVFM